MREPPPAREVGVTTDVEAAWEALVGLNPTLLARALSRLDPAHLRGLLDVLDDLAAEQAR